MLVNDNIKRKTPKLCKRESNGKPNLNPYRPMIRKRCHYNMTIPTGTHSLRVTRQSV